VLVLVVALLGVATMVAVASPASAGFIGDPCSGRHVPGPPRSASAADWPPPLAVTVYYQQPLATTLGYDCVPILRYDVEVLDTTPGVWSDWTYIGSDPGPDFWFFLIWSWPEDLHTYTFRVYAVNRWGRSAPTETNQVFVLRWGP
jgi:hypothetical protein